MLTCLVPPPHTQQFKFEHDTNYFKRNNFSIQRPMYLSPKCNIFDVEQWFDTKSCRIINTFFLPDDLKLKIKQHTDHCFPDGQLSYAKKINLTREEIDMFFPKIQNNLYKEIKKILYTNVKKNIGRDGFLQDRLTNDDINYTCSKILEHVNGSNDLFDCYYLSGKSYNMYILDNNNFTHLIILTNMHDHVNITIEKSQNKMTSVSITNLNGNIMLLYNFYNKYTEELKFCNDKLNYYLNLTEDEFYEHGDDEEELFFEDEDDNDDDAHFMGSKLMNVYYKRIHEIEKKMKHEKHFIDIIVKNNNCNVITHDSYRGNTIKHVSQLKCYTDGKINATYVNTKYESTAMICDAQNNNIFYNIRAYCRSNNDFDIKQSVFGSCTIIPLYNFGDNRKNTTFAIYDSTINNIFIYTSKSSLNVNKIKQNMFNFGAILENFDLINILNVGKIHITEQNNNFLDVTIGTQNDSVISVHFTNKSNEHQIFLFQHEKKAYDEKIKIISYNSECLITKQHINFFQVEKNSLELVLLYKQYLQLFFNQIENENTSQINKKRLKRYKEKNYVCIHNYDVLKIYSNITEYELNNDGLDDYNNFFHTPVKTANKIDQDYIKKLIEATGKMLTHDEICSIIISIIDVKHEYDIKLKDNIGHWKHFRSIIVKNGNLVLKTNNDKIILENNTQLYSHNDTILEILETTDDNIYSIDEYNIGYITENLVFVKNYDKRSKELVTIHDLSKLDAKKRKEFDIQQSYFVLTSETELGKFNFVKETGLQKEFIYHMNVYMTCDDLMLQDANNFVIVCGFGNVSNWVSGFFKSSKTVKHTSSNGGNTSKVVYGNEEVFNKENGVVICNKMRIGKVTNFPQIVWKVAHIKDTSIFHKIGLTNDTYCIIKLYLPEDTIFVRPYNTENWNGQLYMGKSRCNKAVVLAIQEYSFEKEIDLPVGTKAISSHADKCDKLTYKVGQLVLPDQFDESNEECSYGIHVFEERHHIVSLTGDEEVKPTEIIRKIMPKESEIIALANLKIHTDTKIDDIAVDVDEGKKPNKKKIYSEQASKTHYEVDYDKDGVIKCIDFTNNSHNTDYQTESIEHIDETSCLLEKKPTKKKQ